MEEQKLLRRKKKSQISGNRRALAETSRDLASFYFKQGRYDDALDEFREEAQICKDLGLRMEWGNCNRMIGETYMMMAEFDKALKYEEKHLAVAKELSNQVEEQRAMATLGRIYLLQGQSITEAQQSSVCLKAAEKAFMKSLVLCESLKGKIQMHETMDMRARLLLNIGVVLEHLGSVDKAVTFMHKAITICANQDLFEMLHQCYVTEAHLHSSKRKDYSKALACLNKALEVASRLEEKVLKQCETLSLKADILCKMSDYQSAKQVLLKAWKLDAPNEDEKANIEKNLKVVAAMCYTEDLILTTDASDHLALKRLYEKLGDGACTLDNYAGGAEAYRRMLEHAERAGESGKQLIAIYVSLYQTYKDMGLYSEALEFYQKEYELIKDVPKEAYVTLCNIAEASYLAKKPYEHVENACCEARVAAAKLGQKYKIRLLKNLLKYQEIYGETDKMDDTKAELKLLGYFALDNLENSDEDECSSGPSQEQNTTNIGDDICIEDLTDLSDNNEEDVVEQKREARKRGRGFVIKKNAKGETQLHVACISGNKLLAERLLSAGHPVNVRDNAGWLPLHEACIHGHLHIAALLVDHGAHMNDRGGADCDGITPMYDAACNGHLELVQLLLNKGAIPSLQTDFGETALGALQKWRKQNILNKEEEALYKNVCNIINNYLEKRSVEDIGNKSKSKSPRSTTIAVSPPSTSKCNNNDKIIDKVDLPVFRRRNMIDDESEDEVDINKITNYDNDTSDISDDSEPMKPSKKKNPSVSEYRNAISALRNRTISDDCSKEAEIKKSKTRPALLAPDEVDDDWLEDDLGANKNKKRKISDENLIVQAQKKPSIETLKESITNINKTNMTLGEKLNKSNSDRSSSNSRSHLSDVIDDSENSNDSDNFRLTENINPKPNCIDALLKNTKIDLNNTKTSNDSRQNIKKRWKKQSTLLKAGFRRQKDTSEKANLDSYSSNSNSDCEVTNFMPLNESPTKYLALNRSEHSNFSRRLSNDRLSTPKKIDSRPSNFSRKSSNEHIRSPGKIGLSLDRPLTSLSRKPSNERIAVVSNEFKTRGVPSMSMIQPMMHSAQSSHAVHTVMPPAAVRVKVEDKVLLISLNLKTINKLRISWLVEEVKTRYYKLTGVRPVFSLMTSDGAILSEEDPLSLVLTSPELHTCVTNWKASPAEERYLECCAALDIAISEEIQQAIGRSHITHRVALGARTLSSAQVKPLFRALTHQTHLTAVMLSDNNLRDEGVKSLVDCLCTIKQINLLDISNNNITSEGTKSLLDMFVKSTRPVCQGLEQLNICSNPIGDVGFRNVMELSNYVKLKTLRLSNCGVTENAWNCVNKPQINLDDIEVFEISNNNIKQPLLVEIMLRLNARLLVELELENIGVAGSDASVFLGKIFEHTNELKIKKFNLSKCSLTDGDFMKFYRYLTRAKNLQSMTLKNNALTFITLKKLLRRHPPVPQISLQGCPDVFKYCQDSDFPIWLPTIEFGPCIPDINVTVTAISDSQREGYKTFSKIWLNCFKGRGLIERVDDSVVRFTAR